MMLTGECDPDKLHDWLPWSKTAENQDHPGIYLHTDGTCTMISK